MNQEAALTPLELLSNVVQTWASISTGDHCVVMCATLIPNICKLPSGDIANHCSFNDAVPAFPLIKPNFTP